MDARVRILQSIHRDNWMRLCGVFVAAPEIGFLLLAIDIICRLLPKTHCRRLYEICDIARKHVQSAHHVLIAAYLLATDPQNPMQSGDDPDLHAFLQQANEYATPYRDTAITHVREYRCTNIARIAAAAYSTSKCKSTGTLVYVAVACELFARGTYNEFQCQLMQVAKYAAHPEEKCMELWEQVHQPSLECGENGCFCDLMKLLRLGPEPPKPCMPFLSYSAFLQTDRWGVPLEHAELFDVGNGETATTEYTSHVKETFIEYILCNYTGKDCAEVCCVCVSCQALAQVYIHAKDRLVWWRTFATSARKCTQRPRVPVPPDGMTFEEYNRRYFCINEESEYEELDVLDTHESASLRSTSSSVFELPTSSAPSAPVKATRIKSRTPTQRGGRTRKSSRKSVDIIDAYTPGDGEPPRNTDATPTSLRLSADDYTELRVDPSTPLVHRDTIEYFTYPMIVCGNTSHPVIGKPTAWAWVHIGDNLFIPAVSGFRRLPPLTRIAVSVSREILDNAISITQTMSDAWFTKTAIEDLRHCKGASLPDFGSTVQFETIANVPKVALKTLLVYITQLQMHLRFLALCAARSKAQTGHIYFPQQEAALERFGPSVLSVAYIASITPEWTATDCIPRMLGVVIDVKP